MEPITESNNPIKKFITENAIASKIYKACCRAEELRNGSDFGHTGSLMATQLYPSMLGSLPLWAGGIFAARCRIIKALYMDAVLESGDRTENGERDITSQLDQLTSFRGMRQLRFSRHELDILQSLGDRLVHKLTAGTPANALSNLRSLAQLEGKCTELCRALYVGPALPPIAGLYLTVFVLEHDIDLCRDERTTCRYYTWGDCNAFADFLTKYVQGRTVDAAGILSQTAINQKRFKLAAATIVAKNAGETAAQFL